MVTVVQVQMELTFMMFSRLPVGSEKKAVACAFGLSLPRYMEYGAAVGRSLSLDITAACDIRIDTSQRGRASSG